MKKNLQLIISKFLRLIIIKLSNIESNLNPAPTELCLSDGKIKIRAIRSTRDKCFWDIFVSHSIYRTGETDYNFTFPKAISDNHNGDIPLSVKKVLGSIYETESCVWLSIRPDRIKIQTNCLVEQGTSVKAIIKIVISYLKENDKPRLKSRQAYFHSI